MEYQIPNGEIKIIKLPQLHLMYKEVSVNKYSIQVESA